MHILIAATPKSPTGIGQFANRYWPIRQPVLANSPTGIGQFANRYWSNCQLLPWFNGWWFRQYRLLIWPIPVGELANTGWWFRQYRLANWPIPVGDFGVAAIRICIIYMYVLSNPSIPVGELANTGWRFRQYRLANWPIPVGELANTGWRIGQYRLAISPIPAKVHFRRFGQVRGRNRRF